MENEVSLEYIGICEYCEFNDCELKFTYDNKYKLCSECRCQYNNTSTYCSLSCSMGLGCDDSC